MEASEEIKSRLDKALEGGEAEGDADQVVLRERLPKPLSDEVIKQRVLVLEMGVKGGPIHGGAIGDILHANGMKALLHQEIGKRVLDQLPSSRHARVLALEYELFFQHF